MMQYGDDKSVLGLLIFLESENNNNKYNNKILAFYAKHW